MTKRLVQVAALGAASIGAVAAAAPDTAIGRGTRRLAKRLERDVRYAAASAPGLVYRLAGRHPDPDVDDDVLADRIRSKLGPLERRLDVPHVHVMVEDHVAILHGEVGHAYEAGCLELATSEVCGVHGVESHLHHGLIAGDTRPSEGAHKHPQSEAHKSLLASARAAGADDPVVAVHAVLCSFAERIPADERAQVRAHLPTDVRALMQAPVRHGVASATPRTVPQLVAAAAAEGELAPGTAEAITRAVLATLRTLVPDEVRDIAAVLPAPLRGLWTESEVEAS